MINHVSFTSDEERIVKTALLNLMNDILRNEQKRQGRPSIDSGFDCHDYKEALYVLKKIESASEQAALQLKGE